MTTDPQVITLTQSILLELYKTIGIDKKRLLIRLVQPIVWLPARRFAALAVEFDRAVAEHGLVGACRIYLPKYIERVHFEGDENIPSEGPLLVCSNHPGVFDLFAIISRFPRDDLRLIISGVPFTRNVPAASKYLLYVPEDIQGRMNALRSAIHHLQEGGMVMIFPSGRVDPDPALLPGASEALNGWSPSLEIMLNRAQDTKIVLAVVSGVLSRNCLNHPLTRVRKDPYYRLKVAEYLQSIEMSYFNRRFELDPWFSFSKPFTTGDFHGNDPRDKLLPGIIDKENSLLSTHMMRRELEAHPG